MRTPSKTFLGAVGRAAFDNHAGHLNLYRVERLVPEMDGRRISSRRQLHGAIRVRLGIADQSMDFANLLSA